MFFLITHLQICSAGGCCSKLQREVLCFEERVRQQDVLKDPVKQADLPLNAVM